MKVSAYSDDWREIVYCRLENQQIDFKAPQNWNLIGRPGRAKLARHAIAMANTLVGYVVIGVGEDANGIPNQYIGMTEEEASSFDPSAVGQALSSFADPPVSLDIVRPIIDGRRYVVIVVYPFTGMPHVCSNACESELQRGAFYIRTPDARSKVAVKSSELHLLIQRCLRNQRQMLGRMLRGILYEDRQTDSPEMELLPPLLERSRRSAMERIGKKSLHSLPYFELSAQPNKLFRDVGLGELRRSIELMERPTFGEIIGGGKDESYEMFATNDSLCVLRRVGEGITAYLEFYQSGLVFVAALFTEENPAEKRVSYSEVARFAINSMKFLGQAYTNVCHPEAILDICIRIPNSDGAEMTGMGGASPAVCRIMDVEVAKQRSAGDLEAGAASDTAAQFFAEICERFNAKLDSADIAETKMKFSSEF